MGKFNSILLGRVHNSVGNVTMSYRGKENIVKAKIFTRKETYSPLVELQRSRFGLLSQLATVFQETLRKGFPEKGGANARNCFISQNHSQVTADESGCCTIEPEQIRCAAGRMCMPEVEMEYDAGEGMFVFSQLPQEVKGKFCVPDDRVYGVLYESVLNRSRLVALQERGEGGETRCSLPEEWQPECVHAWCFATDRCGKRASGSRYVEVKRV